jgi:hypothetical protein
MRKETHCNSLVGLYSGFSVGLKRGGLESFSVSFWFSSDGVKCIWQDT